MVTGGSVATGATAATLAVTAGASAITGTADVLLPELELVVAVVQLASNAQHRLKNAIEIGV